VTQRAARAEPWRVWERSGDTRSVVTRRHPVADRAVGTVPKVGLIPVTSPEPRHPSVFIGQTRELREFPERRSFVAAAESAVISARCLPVDMRYFAARDDKPADYCERMVSQADIYVIVAGFRYGSPVPDRPTLSHNELEFEAAARLDLPRLVFLLDERESYPIPARELIDVKYGRRQDRFRQRLQRERLVAKVADPSALEHELFRALIELLPNLPGRPAPQAWQPGRKGKGSPPAGGIMYGRSSARLNGLAWRQGHPSLGDLMARTDTHPTETWLKTDVTWWR
jgi:uncharacterized protein DUF4062